MSFLVDPPLLFADGELYARALPEPAQGRAAVAVGGATVATFLAVGIGSYLGHGWAKPLWKALGARSGAAFMLGWPVAHRSRRKRTAGSDALAVAAFASYPFWWWLGWDHGRRARP